MKFLPSHSNFRLPTKGTEDAGAYDIYMPEAGQASDYEGTKVLLGFYAEVPAGHVALILPRSGVGSKHGLELNNTCGVIDPDYRGEWFVILKTKHFPGYKWAAGDRILQYLLVPTFDSPPERVHVLSPTSRGSNGGGSTGK